MALAVVQHVAAGSAAVANTVTVTVTSTGANRLLVAIAGSQPAAGAVSGVSDGTTAFTRASGSSCQITGGFFSEAWYLPLSASGKTAITATFTAAAGGYGKVIHFYEVSGFTLATLDDVQALSDQTAGSTTVNGVIVTGTTAAAFGAASVLSSSVITQNPLSGNVWTAGGDIDTAGVAAVSVITSASGTSQPQWLATASGALYGTNAVLFKETPTGAFRNFYPGQSGSRMYGEQI